MLHCPAYFKSNRATQTNVCGELLRKIRSPLHCQIGCTKDAYVVVGVRCSCTLGQGSDMVAWPRGRARPCCLTKISVATCSSSGSVGNAIKKWRNVLDVSPGHPPTTPDKNHPPENGLSHFSVHRYLPPFFTIFGGSLVCRPLPSGEMPLLAKCFR